MRTGNPALNDSVFRQEAMSGDRFSIEQGLASPSSAMTVNGTISKTGILLAVLSFTAILAWRLVEKSPELSTPLIFGGAISGLVLGLITTFKPNLAPYTSPIYAGCQGLFLGTLTYFFNQMSPGIGIQAVGLTAGTLGVMLLAYRSGLIKVTEKFRMGIVAATGAIMLFYLISFVASVFFGYQMPVIYGNSWISIGFSLLVVGIAALNLVLDFDFIEKGAEMNAPKHMEWYGAFGLLVTLVWLYIEILRLLSKIQSRD